MIPKWCRSWRWLCLLLLAVVGTAATTEIDHEYEQFAKKLLTARRQFLEKKTDRRKYDLDEASAFQAYAKTFRKAAKELSAPERARIYMTQMRDLFNDKLIDRRRLQAERQDTFEALLKELAGYRKEDPLDPIRKLYDDGLLDKQMLKRALSVLSPDK